MPRPRFQNGYVCAVGKKRRGEWYETVHDSDGTATRRIHHSRALDAHNKTEAKQKLAEILTPFQNIRPDGSVPLRAFIELKFLPLKEGRWKDSTKLTSLGIIQKQILEPLSVPSSHAKRETVCLTHTIFLIAY